MMGTPESIRAYLRACDPAEINSAKAVEEIKQSWPDRYGCVFPEIPEERGLISISEALTYIAEIMGNEDCIDKVSKIKCILHGTYYDRDTVFHRYAAHIDHNDYKETYRDEYEKREKLLMGDYFEYFDKLNMDDCFTQFHSELYAIENICRTMFYVRHMHGSHCLYDTQGVLSYTLKPDNSGQCYL